MPGLEVIRDGSFRADAQLTAEIAAVVAPSITDTVGRLEREFRRCDTLYLHRDSAGRITCFFLVAWETLDVEGEERPALYTGLSAARPDLKGTCRTVRLYDYCAAEAREWQQRHQPAIVVWGMTASPTVYRAAGRVFADVQPAADGTYSAEAGRVARAVRQRLGWPLPGGAHPFVFPGIVAGVHYSEDERRRVATVEQAKRFTLFDRLGVDEARGDRLLFVCRVPDVPWRRGEGGGDE